MVKYDYSLDVGESIKTDEVLKKKEKKEPACCGDPPKKRILSDEDKIKEPQETTEKEPEQAKEKQSQKTEKSDNEEEPIEEEQLENIPETKPSKEPEKKEETVKIKPISFEKAKLVSDYAQESEKNKEEGKKETKEQKTEKPDAETQQETEKEYSEKREEIFEEDEKDVNEFLEDSFKKETQTYNQHNNKPKNNISKEKDKKSIWPIIILAVLILTAAGIYTYAIFSEPSQPTTTDTLEIINKTNLEINANNIETININKTMTKTKQIINENATEEPPAETRTPETENITVTNALDILTESLKDD